MKRARLGDTLTSARHAEMLAAAVVRFEFREPTAGESLDGYIGRLITHVAERDLAAAHELRVGKPQAEWDNEDVTAFHKRMTRPRRAGFDDPAVPFACLGFDHGERLPVTDESLLLLADKALAFAVDFRTKDATKDLYILATVLLTTGDVFTATPDRDDRFRVIRHLAQTKPVYGYVVMSDAYIHSILHEPGKPQTATKQDALMVHVGSRSMRQVIVQPYRISGSQAVFEERRDVPPGEMTEDPYAGLLVSVPVPTGKPS